MYDESGTLSNYIYELYWVDGMPTYKFHKKPLELLQICKTLYCTDCITLTIFENCVEQNKPIPDTLLRKLADDILHFSKHLVY